MAKTFSGDTTFLVGGVTRAHRYEIKGTPENALAIWLEDRKSKKQWQAGTLALEHFVTADNAIPRASAAMYAELFARCLSTSEAEYKHELVLEDGEWWLALTLPLQIATVNMHVSFKFALQEVPLERVDLLDARVRDLEEYTWAVPESRIRQLEEKNESIQAQIDELKRKVNELNTLAKTRTFGREKAF